MRPGRIIALVIGSIIALVAFGLLLAAGAIGVATVLERDDDGYFDVSLERIESDTAAVVSGDDLTFATEPGTPDWVIDALDIDVRLDVTSVADPDVFVGIARTADLDRYLRDVAHDVVVDVDDRRPVLERRDGSADLAEPGEQDFWAASTTGPGAQRLEWEAEAGRWSAIVMNADASPGVAFDVDVGARAGFLVPLAFVLAGLGLVALVAAILLIVWGARGTRQAAGAQVAGAPVAPAVAEGAPSAGEGEPVAVSARLDADLSRWQWLVKWFLAIPHLIVLAFLWIAFFVVTFVAGIAILFTGRYPRSLFEFSVGVLRWSWRVAYYAFTGGLGTDRYPPFSLAHDPDYPATLHIAEPGQLSRGLVLVKWWLLAIPHYLVLAILLGGSNTWVDVDGDTVVVWSVASFGLINALVLIAAVGLLFTGRYHRPLFDLVIGLNRWVVRVVAYVALMTDRYPPFRLDQGGTDPGDAPGEPPAAAPGTLAPWQPPEPTVR